jgi:hypothetical protein
LLRIFGVEQRTTAAGPVGGDTVVSPAVQCAPKRSPFPRRWIGWAAAAAVLLLAVATWQFHPWGNRARRSPPGTPGASEVASGDVLLDGAPARTIPPGSAIRIAGSVPATIHLADGSEAEFEPGARAVLHGSVPGLRQWIELNEGGGTFRVEKANGEFEVETQLGCVIALGTEFSVRLRPAHEEGESNIKMHNVVLAVAVLSGLVQVKSGSDVYVLGGGESRVFAQELEGKHKPENVRGGSIVSVDATKIVLKNRNGETTYELAADVQVTIDGKPAKIDALAKDMFVVAENKPGEKPIAAIKAEGPTVGGQVKSIDAEKSTITLTTGGGHGPAEQTLAMAPDVAVSSDNKSVKLGDIQPGTAVAVKLSVDRKTVVAITKNRGR